MILVVRRILVKKCFDGQPPTAVLASLQYGSGMLSADEGPVANIVVEGQGGGHSLGQIASNADGSIIDAAVVWLS